LSWYALRVINLSTSPALSCCM